MGRRPTYDKHVRERAAALLRAGLSAEEVARRVKRETGVAPSRRWVSDLRPRQRFVAKRLEAATSPVVGPLEVVPTPEQLAEQCKRSRASLPASVRAWLDQLDGVCVTAELAAAGVDDDLLVAFEAKLAGMLSDPAQLAGLVLGATTGADQVNAWQLPANEREAALRKRMAANHRAARVVLRAALESIGAKP